MLRPPSTDLRAIALRSAIAGWLVGDARVSPEALVGAHGAAAVLAAIEHEGLVSLVHVHFSDPSHGWSVPPTLAAPLAARARKSAARGLLCQAEARRIQHVLDQAAIPALWLKGIALGRWLYPQPYLRDITDIDLLFPDHATTLRAAEVLVPLGYALPNPHIAGDLVVHELLACSASTRLELDLHWDVSNGALFAGLLPWSTLHAEAIPLPGLSAHGLSAVYFEGAAAVEPVRTARLRHWGYFQWACWQRLPTLRARVTWLRQLLFPDMAHLRVRYGADGAGPLLVSARRMTDGVRRWWGYALRPPG